MSTVKVYEYRSETSPSNWDPSFCKICKLAQKIGNKPLSKDCDTCKKPLTIVRRVRVKPLTKKQIAYLEKIPRLNHRLIVKQYENLHCPFGENIAETIEDTQVIKCNVTGEAARFEDAKLCSSSSFPFCPNFKSRKALTLYRKQHWIEGSRMTEAQEYEQWLRFERLGVYSDFLSDSEIETIFKFAEKVEKREKG